MTRLDHDSRIGPVARFRDPCGGICRWRTTSKNPQQDSRFFLLSPRFLLCAWGISVNLLSIQFPSFRALLLAHLNTAGPRSLAQTVTTDFVLQSIALGSIPVVLYQHTDSTLTPSPRGPPPPPFRYEPPTIALVSALSPGLPTARERPSRRNELVRYTPTDCRQSLTLALTHRPRRKVRRFPARSQESPQDKLQVRRRICRPRWR